ncbi:MAG TPA: molybdenum cofactor guanylyltransferase MobA [Candidatus Cybelea sp.]|nr:molybdenum cofactor guanylyltransferase MobA [Candidatus Cybelea sp.]
MPPERRPGVAAVLLAGGLARRMGGGDKCLRMLGGKPLLQRVIETVSPQVAALVLNANGDPARFGQFKIPVVADVVEGYAGPLAGILSGMEWAERHLPACRWLLSVPTDAPFLPRDLAARLCEAVERGAELACAASAGQVHPVIGLWPVAMAGDLRRALIDEDMRKIDKFTARYRLTTVEWSDQPVDPFFNANRPEDLAEAERLVRLLDRP